jgi:hypothetical protein
MQDMTDHYDALETREPGGFIFDASARALGCAVISAGPATPKRSSY